jgi:two-component system response regulator FlrC
MAVTKVGRTLAEIEREHILDTLTYCGGNRTYAAIILDISVRGLRNKLSRYSRAGWSISAHGGAQSRTASRFGAERREQSLNSIVWC